MHITTEQRVLLHIYRYGSHGGGWEAPYEISQSGISGALHLPQSTISRALKSLKSRGLVLDRVMYIRGEKRKKSAYFPSSQGMEEARRLLEEIEKIPVKIRDEEHIMELSFGEALKYIGKRKGVSPYLLDIYEISRKEGVVDIAVFGAKKRIIFHAPESMGHFVGRSGELSAITENIRDFKVIVVKGMAGMGKTSLLLRASEKLAGRYDIFWYTARKGHRELELMKELNEFLKILGKKTVDRKRGAAGFFEALRDIEAVLILDDFQFAGKETRDFAKGLAERMLTEAVKFRVIVSTREEPGIFGRSQIARGRVYELELRALRKEELAELFPDRDDLERAYSVTGGIPLFVNLYTNVGFRVSDARKILDEEVFSSLGQDEKKALRTVSVHRIPVYPEALYDTDSGILEKLREKLLLFDVGEGKLDLHDLLKESLYRSMSLGERRKFHEKAAEYYLSPWCGDEERFEAVYHLQMAGKWEEAAEKAVELASELPLYGNISGTLMNFHRNADKIPEKLKGDLLLLTGDSFAYEGKWEECMRYYRMAEEILGTAEEIEERVARANAEMENWGESMEIERRLLERAMKKGDDIASARHRMALGNICLRSGNLKDAVKNYLEAEKILLRIRNRKGLAVIYNNLGTAYIKIGELRKAEKYLRESLKYSKGKGWAGAQAVSNLGYIYEKKGENDSAEKAYREGMKFMRKDPANLIKMAGRLASLLSMDGRWREALEMLEESLGDIPEQEKWRIWNLMADVYRSEKRFEEAIKMRKKAMSGTDDPSIRISLIEDFKVAGRIEEALKLMEKEEKRVVPWDYTTKMRILMLKAEALVVGGRKKDAAEVYMELIRIAEEAGDDEFAESVRKKFGNNLKRV